jgi:PKD repeat protein
VDGVAQSTSQDFSTLFNNTAPKAIKLQASIPGCTHSKTSTINSINQGPLTDFTFSNACVGTSVSFSNQTSGQVTTYAWDFGDGNTSNQTDTQNTFISAGHYNVKLIANNTAGCQNSATKKITIYSKPQPSFSLDLPPFSCSGTPSQFNDTTPNPTDSNLSSWVWSFGDAANGFSTQRNPLYTYSSAGAYSVGLSVTTNFGCSASIQKSITITLSPTASFVHTPACVVVGTQFTDTSTGSIKSWLWKIDNNTYTFSNPLQVFGAPGTFSAELTVTGNNNCIAQTSQQIIVPLAQLPNFSAQSTCATKPAVFQDTTPSGTDPITSVSWEFGGQGSGSGSPAQFTFSVTGNFSVKMDALTQSGCVYSVAKTIAVVSPPDADFTTSNDAGPVPLVVQFTNTSTNATGYVWHFHDKTNSTTTDPSPSFMYNELGEYIVDLEATNSLGCLDTFSKIISAVVPRVDAGLSGLQFLRDPSSGEYQALFVIDNAGNLPLTNPTILVEISGKVNLKEKLNLTVLPGQSMSQILNYSLLPGGLEYICLSVDVAQDATIYNNKECVNLTNETIGFQPYPNPVNGELHLDWIAAAAGMAQLTIFNSAGAKAFDRSLQASVAGLNQIRLDVSNLSPGMYLIVFNYSGQKKTFRFAIQ